MTFDLEVRCRGLPSCDVRAGLRGRCWSELLAAPVGDPTDPGEPMLVTRILFCSTQGML